MTKYSDWASRLCYVGLIAGGLTLAGTGTVFADPPGRYDGPGIRWDGPGPGDRRGGPGDRRDERGDRDDSRHQPTDWRRQHAPEYPQRERYRTYPQPPKFFYRGRPYWAPPNRARQYRDIVIVRPYGHWYPGYGRYRRDSDAYKWLAFTAITLGLLDYLSEAQQREHEAAQIAATTAPIGERITWHEGDAGGSVVATREGTSESGRYCREFQQQVTIGGRIEDAYGTACRNPDGSWEVVSGD